MDATQKQNSKILDNEPRPHVPFTERSREYERPEMIPGSLIEDDADDEELYVSAWSSIARFEYRPLDAGRKEIRLFKLLPTSQHTISIGLEHFSIDNAPPYRAISYRWGFETARMPVSISGKPLLIGESLYDLLYSHAQHLDQLYFWADQICINQDSTGERNSQVQLMGELFRGAEEVIVWLGLHSESKLAVSAMAALESHFESNGKSYKFWRAGSRSQDKLREKIKSLPSQERQALRTLARNPYWERHWIIQEVHLARSRRLFYGTEVINWRLLRVVMQAFSSLDSQLDAFALQKILSHTGFTFLEWSRAMQLCQDSLCQDPRDKVFGIQDVLPAALRIEIDYTKSVREIFMRAAWTYSRHRRVSYPLYYYGLVNLAVGMRLTSRTRFSRDLDMDQWTTEFVAELDDIDQEGSNSLLDLERRQRFEMVMAKYVLLYEV